MVILIVRVEFGLLLFPNFNCNRWFIIDIDSCCLFDRRFGCGFVDYLSFDKFLLRYDPSVSSFSSNIVEWSLGSAVHLNSWAV